jgi:L-aminopeptidase/D-esterase-like protein
MPIVAGGIIMDLNVGSDPTIRPDAEGAFQACLKARSGPIEEATVGGGAGGPLASHCVIHAGAEESSFRIRKRARPSIPLSCAGQARHESILRLLSPATKKSTWALRL